jgi:hypothetical protein
MIAEGMTMRAAAEELRVSATNLSKWASHGMGEIDCLDKILRSKKRAGHTGPSSQLKALAANIVLLARAALATHLRPMISMTIPLGWMGSPNEKGAGATVGAATRTGGDFFSARDFFSAGAGASAGAAACGAGAGTPDFFWRFL